MTVMRRVSLDLRSRFPEELLDVLPDLLLQHVGNQEEHEQEADHANAKLLTFPFDGLADVVEEVDDVAHDVVELLDAELAGPSQVEALEDLRAVLVGGEYRALRTLQLPEHMRHRRARQ